MIDIVGCTEVAERLGVQPRTVIQWRQRDLMPEEEWTVSGVPAWRWETIRAWAEKTGRAQGPPPK